MLTNSIDGALTFQQLSDLCGSIKTQTQAVSRVMCSCQHGTDFYGTGLGADWGPWWASEIAYFCRLLPDHKWLMCGNWFSVIHHAHHLTRFCIGWDIINSWVFIEHQPKKYVSSHVRGSVTFGTWFLIHFVLVWFCFVVNDDVVIFVVNVSSEHLCVMLISPFQGEWQIHFLQIQVEYVTGGNWPNLHNILSLSFLQQIHWWSQWGCYGRWSRPYMLLLRVRVP